MLTHSFAHLLENRLKNRVELFNANSEDCLIKTQAIRNPETVLIKHFILFCTVASAQISLFFILCHLLIICIPFGRLVAWAAVVQAYLSGL